MQRATPAGRTSLLVPCEGLGLALASRPDFAPDFAPAGITPEALGRSSLSAQPGARPPIKAPFLWGCRE
jgi:hypothetical protein